MMQKALAALLGALSAYLLFGMAGVLGMGAVLVNLFTPLPMALVGMRFGSVWGVVAAALAALAVLATSGFPALWLFVLQFAVPAAMLPWLLRRKGARWDTAVVATLGVILLLGGIFLGVLAWEGGQSLPGLVDQLVDKEISQAVTLMQDFAAGSGQSPAEVEAVRDATVRMGEFMRRVYPGMLIAIGSALLLVTVGLVALLMRGAPGFPGPAFASWKAPEPLIWGVIAAGFAVVLSSGTVQSVALNLLVILLPVYFLQGLAVVECFLGRKRWSPLLRGICYVFLLLINPLPMIVTGVGVFDLWVNFRKPRLRSE